MIIKVTKLLFFTYLLYVSVRSYLNPEYWPFIQYVNLIFHEAGHVLFIFFGQFISVLGGSLLEILIPLLITIYFFLKRDYFATAFSTWWLSTAFYSVSVYAGYAVSRNLKLLGGDSVIHDWYFILNTAGIIRYDQQISGLLFAISICTLVLSLWLLYRDTLGQVTRSINV